MVAALARTTRGPLDRDALSLEGLLQQCLVKWHFKQPEAFLSEQFLSEIRWDGLGRTLKRWVRS